jgi:hypothetical protein
VVVLETSGGKPERKITQARPGHNWEDKINTDIREIRGHGMDCIRLAQNKNQWRDLVNPVMNTVFRRHTV